MVKIAGGDGGRGDGGCGRGSRPAYPWWDFISVSDHTIMGALANGGAVISAQHLGRNSQGRPQGGCGQLVSYPALSMVWRPHCRHRQTGIFWRHIGKWSVMDNVPDLFLIPMRCHNLLSGSITHVYLFRSMQIPQVSMMTSLVISQQCCRQRQFVCLALR